MSQREIISNLITDMILRGATRDELTRVINHSVVVLDFEKSEIDNNITALKKKY